MARHISLAADSTNFAPNLYSILRLRLSVVLASAGEDVIPIPYKNCFNSIGDWSNFVVASSRIAELCQYFFAPAAGLTHLIASALRRCASIVRSRRLRKEQGGFAAAANLKDIYHNILN
ncbi:MAG: hypothetical protein LBU06_00180 [Desulfovibrio sp.]|jgi:hypothetical protein|nr:hypothetical protein [Desulfovibrio sp.]